MATSTTTTRGQVIDIKKKGKKPPRKREKIPRQVLLQWDPTEEEREKVKMMVAGGMKLEDICKCVHPQGPISITALKSRFKKEVKEGRADITKRVIEVATRMALSGKHPGMTIFWLKTNAGWTESGAGKVNVGNTKFGVTSSVAEEITQRLQKTAKIAAETLPRAKTGTGN